MLFEETKQADSVRERQFAIRLMEHLVVPTFVLDPQGKVIIWNRACERLTNVRATDVLGTTDHWKAFYEERRVCLADLVREGRLREVEDMYAEACLKKDVYDGVRAENWCVMPRAERRLYLAINCGPIFDDDGKMIAVVETVRDMTDQKKAEMALESLAHKDGLTGLANRRSFDMALESDLMQSQREREPLSLLLCDVDYFKLYNDTYGHQAGDECLKKIARTLDAQAFRATDLAARYGGEEFAMIIPGADINGARRIGERIRQSIYDLEIEHKSNPALDRVTISIGAVSLIPKCEDNNAGVIERADKALYQAKEGGRNQICVCQG